MRSYNRYGPAPKHLATQIGLNPLRGSLHPNVAEHFLHGDARALTIAPRPVEVASERDVSLRYALWSDWEPEGRKL